MCSPGQGRAAGSARLHAAGAARRWVRGRRSPARLAWPGLVGALALTACLAAPRAAPQVGALARLTVYASLLCLFAGSLRPGREPLVTRLARRVHPALTCERIAYTRGVTWLWTVFFATEIALWSAVLAATAHRRMPRSAAWADLPLLAALLVGEMGVRAIKFRGQPHGSFRDTLRAVRGV